MFAKNRCRVASFSLRCLRLSKRFCKKTQNRCTLRLEFICKRKIGTTMTHIQIMLNMSTHRPLRFIVQVLNYVCIYMVQLYLTSFSSVQTQGRCPPFFPFHMVLTGGSWPGPHTTGAIPRRQAEALHRRALAGREAHLGANHPETLTSMNNLALLLRQQGKLDEAG